jgi:type III pantothenate kinase
MINLVIDIGNTRIKTASFIEDRLVDEQQFKSVDQLRLYTQGLVFDQALISSVSHEEEELKTLLDFPFLYLSRQTPVPIQNLYGTPETLGVDRKAAVIGARVKIPQGPLLAIDMGSCITFDVLDEHERYYGGAISPGVNMRFKAMHTQTARLPLVALEVGEVPPLIGDNTVNCLKSGVYYGVLFEIKEFINTYMEQYRDLKVIICGGDSIFFESLTKDHIFVIPNLVLFGLNRILRYNVN